MSDEQRATFTQMIDGTPEEWMLVGMSAVQFNRKLADRVLEHFKLLDGDFGGYAVRRVLRVLRQIATGRDDDVAAAVAGGRTVGASVCVARAVVAEGGRFARTTDG